MRGSEIELAENHIMDEEEEEIPTCPLCLEELDSTDRAVEACQCGYQVCLWCLHHIREQLNGKCPACRTPYQEQNFKYGEVNPEQAAKEAKERATAKKERERREKMKEIEKERARAVAVSQQKAKSNLKHARILQKNLVYVIGLSLSLAREEVIRRADMFGKFGRVLRILINKSHPFNSDAPGGPSISAYVQYFRDSDASAAVRSMNNAVFDGREIRCAIATTKYCDVFVRNVGSPNPAAAHYCGNQNCMYYHSLAPEDTFTREEVLARQLGPPPPAHLFLPPNNGRPPHQIPTLHHRVGPHTGVLANPAHRPLPLRSMTGSQAPIMNPSSSAIPPIHPPSVTLPSIASSLNNPPIHSSTATSNNMALSSPLHSPRPPATASIIRKSHAASSPQRTPPSSPPELSHRRLQILHRSPGMPESTGTHTQSTTAFPLVSPASANRSSAVPIPSSAGWASTEPGRSISRSPPRRGTSILTEDLSRPSIRDQLRKSRDNAPPGFEDAPTHSSPAVLSRPPGFDGPAAKITPEEPRPGGTRRDAQDERKPPAPMPAPPGFDTSPSTKRDIAKEPTTEVAAAWSQEASSDEVFSARARRPIRGTVGQVSIRTTHVAQDSPDSRSGLAEVLAKIGGDLGVSSEFQNVQINATPPRSSIQSSSVSLGRGSQQTKLQRSGPVENLFSSQRGGQGLSSNGASRNKSGSSVSAASASTRRVNPSSKRDAYPHPLSRERALSAKTEVSRPARRSDSRFGFAREHDVHEAIAQSGNSRSAVLPTDHQISRTLLTQMATRPNGPPALLEASPVKDLKPPNLSRSFASSGNRQLRSRFDFADRASSPPKAPHTQNVSQNSDGTAHREVSRGSGSALPGTNPMAASFANMSTEEKLASLFNSAQWSDSLPPMPPFEPQVDHLSYSDDHATTANPGTNLGSGNAAAPTDGYRTTSPLNSGTLSGGDSRPQARAPSHPRPVQFAPPGFREATPGISPESTAVDHPSTSTGVASNVASGGAESISNSPSGGVPSYGEESLSSGTESLEEDRKRSRAQRKREKKARQVKQAAERKGADQKTSVRVAVSQAEPVPVTQPVQVTHSVQTAQLVLPTQPVKPNHHTASVEVAKPVPQIRESAPPAASQAHTLSKTNGQMLEAPRLLLSRNEQSTQVEVAVGMDSTGTANVGIPQGKINDNSGKYMSVSELEREVEAARAREAKLQDRLLELQRRIRSYDNNIRT